MACRESSMPPRSDSFTARRRHLRKRILSRSESVLVQALALTVAPTALPTMPFPFLPSFLILVRVRALDFHPSLRQFNGGASRPCLRHRPHRAFVRRFPPPSPLLSSSSPSPLPPISTPSAPPPRRPAPRTPVRLRRLAVGPRARPSAASTAASAPFLLRRRRRQTPVAPTLRRRLAPFVIARTLPRHASEFIL